MDSGNLYYLFEVTHRTFSIWNQIENHFGSILIIDWKLLRKLDGKWRGCHSKSKSPGLYKVFKHDFTYLVIWFSESFTFPDNESFRQTFRDWLIDDPFHPIFSVRLLKLITQEHQTPTNPFTLHFQKIFMHRIHFQIK